MHLTNAYFVPDPQLLEALKDAARRGVDVKLILPSADRFLAGVPRRALPLRELLRGGVKIYERRGALLHAKTALIDGVWSTVGSTNLDWRSFLHNDEVNAVVLGASSARRCGPCSSATSPRREPITLEQWRRAAAGDAAAGRLARLVAVLALSLPSSSVHRLHGRRYGGRATALFGDLGFDELGQRRERLLQPR